jgi:nitrogen regulatory protein PII
MTGRPRKLVTIVAESALEGRIVEELSKFAVSGYTITDARGTGSRGRRAGDTSDTGNIRCEVVCKEGVAEALVEQLLDEYGRDYALVAYLSDVTVVRADKF